MIVWLALFHLGPGVHASRGSTSAVAVLMWPFSVFVPDLPDICPSVSVSRVTPRPLSAPSELRFDALAGRGHALFLETLIFNELQNEAWKRGQKKSAFPRLVQNGI